MKPLALTLSLMLSLALLFAWLPMNGSKAGAANSSQQGTLTVMAAGDIACDPASSHFNHGQGDKHQCHEMATSDLMLAAHPDAVLSLGDNQYGHGTLAEFFQSFDPSWGRLKNILHPIPGNEDYVTPRAAGYFSYFGSGAGQPGTGDYSFTLGSWHFIALNSECTQWGVGGCGIDGQQERWLLNDLAANRSPCTLAFWHKPRFTSGGNLNHPEVQAFWDDLYAYGAAIVLNGHDHYYERFAPQNPKQQADPRGIQEFIVGTGGRSHETKLGTLQPNSEVRDSTTYGVLKLSLHSGSYDWQFLPDHQAGNGKFTDSGTGTCHGINAGTENGAGPRAVPIVSADGSGGMVARFMVDFTSHVAGQGEVLFGTGPGCNGLVQTATQDAGAGTTRHAVHVEGNDLPGTVGDPGIQPGTTYWYETATVNRSGMEVDNNGGKCYSVTVPSS
jgi:hypothetical protein